MMADHRSAKFHKLRDSFAAVVVPIEEVVNSPVRLIHWIGVSLTSRETLLEENAQLKAQQFLLQARLQKLLTLEKQNAQLLELLKSSPQVAGKVAVAQLLAVDLSPDVQEIVLDRGTRGHVYRGQPVLDAYGVMGQVIDVGPLTSKVLLINDPRSAIPVKDYRTGDRAIAIGLGSTDQLAIINLPPTNTVKLGDLFVTSGLGLRYPVGYPVGVVSSISRGVKTGYTEIQLTPSAHLDRTQQVLLAWPNHADMLSEVKKELAKKLPSATYWRVNNNAS